MCCGLLGAASWKEVALLEARPVRSHARATLTSRPRASLAASALAGRGRHFATPGASGDTRTQQCSLAPTPTIVCDCRQATRKAADEFQSFRAGGRTIFGNNNNNNSEHSLEAAPTARSKKQSRSQAKKPTCSRQEAGQVAWKSARKLERDERAEEEEASRWQGN